LALEWELGFGSGSARKMVGLESEWELARKMVALESEWDSGRIHVHYTEWVSESLPAWLSE
jgi:hypothetical protein